MDTVDVHVGGSSIPYPLTPEGKAAAAEMQARVMSPSDMPLTGTPEGFRPTARQLAFNPSPIPATVPAAKNASPYLAATNIVATINKKRQDISKAAAAAAEELAELEATAMALGFIVPPSSTHQTNSPTQKIAAALQRSNIEQEATRHPTQPTTILQQHTDPSLPPAAQKPVQLTQDNNASRPANSATPPDNNATQEYSQQTYTQPSPAPAND